MGGHWWCLRPGLLNWWAPHPPTRFNIQLLVWVLSSTVLLLLPLQSPGSCSLLLPLPDPTHGAKAVYRLRETVAGRFRGTLRGAAWWGEKHMAQCVAHPGGAWDPLSVWPGACSPGAFRSWTVLSYTYEECWTGYLKANPADTNNLKLGVPRGRAVGWAPLPEGDMLKSTGWGFQSAGS